MHHIALSFHMQYACIHTYIGLTLVQGLQCKRNIDTHIHITDTKNQRKPKRNEQFPTILSISIQPIDVKTNSPNDTPIKRVEKIR